MSKLAVIYNPRSGKGQASKQAIEAGFRPYEKDLLFLDISDGYDKLAASIRRHNVALLVAAGGDGTVNTVARIAVSCDLPMGVLPLGTLNHFARDLGLPEDCEAAAKVIANGRIHKVDYCTVNDKLFINTSSLGLYPLAVREREKRQPALGKWLALLIAAAQVGITMQRLRISISMGHKVQRFKTPLIFIGNNSYQLQKWGFANRQHLDKGILYLYVVKATRLSSLLATVVLLLFGKRFKGKDFLMTDRQQVIIKLAEPKVKVALDGEVKVLTTPLHYRIHPRALRVKVSSKPRA